MARNTTNSRSISLLKLGWQLFIGFTLLTQGTRWGATAQESNVCNNSDIANGSVIIGSDIDLTCDKSETPPDSNAQDDATSSRTDEGSNFPYGAVLGALGTATVAAGGAGIGIAIRHHRNKQQKQFENKDAAHAFAAEMLKEGNIAEREQSQRKLLKEVSDLAEFFNCVDTWYTPITDDTTTPSISTLYFGEQKVGGFAAEWNTACYHALLDEKVLLTSTKTVDVGVLNRNREHIARQCVARYEEAINKKSNTQGVLHLTRKVTTPGETVQNSTSLSDTVELAVRDANPAAEGKRPSPITQATSTLFADTDVPPPPPPLPPDAVLIDMPTTAPTPGSC